MLVHRVFPALPNAHPGEPGHPTFIHPDQGSGRWDNPGQYRMFYCATSAEAAVGESFAHLSTWSRSMLTFPQLPGSVRKLGTYRLDEERCPILDFDDAKTLLDRGLRPTQVVIRNRPFTQRTALEIYEEDQWAGISWWSLHRPQWRLLALFSVDAVEPVDIDELVGHPAVSDAAARLAKPVAGDLEPV